MRRLEGSIGGLTEPELLLLRSRCLPAVGLRAREELRRIERELHRRRGDGPSSSPMAMLTTQRAPPLRTRPSSATAAAMAERVCARPESAPIVSASRRTCSAGARAAMGVHGLKRPTSSGADTVGRCARRDGLLILREPMALSYPGRVRSKPVHESTRTERQVDAAIQAIYPRWDNAKLVEEAALSAITTLASLPKSPPRSSAQSPARSPLKASWTSTSRSSLLCETAAQGIQPPGPAEGPWSDAVAPVSPQSAAARKTRTFSWTRVAAELRRQKEQRQRELLVEIGAADDMTDAAWHSTAVRAVRTAWSGSVINLDPMAHLPRPLVAQHSLSPSRAAVARAKLVRDAAENERTGQAVPPRGSERPDAAAVTTRAQG